MVTDIACIQTQQGSLYLAAVLDLSPSQAADWSARLRIDSEQTIYALLMADWWRNSKEKILVPSDRECQKTSYDCNPP
jgi:hypothetical protein